MRLSEYMSEAVSSGRNRGMSLPKNAKDKESIILWLDMNGYEYVDCDGIENLTLKTIADELCWHKMHDGSNCYTYPKENTDRWTGKGIGIEILKGNKLIYMDGQNDLYFIYEVSYNPKSFGVEMMGLGVVARYNDIRKILEAK